MARVLKYDKIKSKSKDDESEFGNTSIVGKDLRIGRLRRLPTEPKAAWSFLVPGVLDDWQKRRKSHDLNVFSSIFTVPKVFFIVILSIFLFSVVYKRMRFITIKVVQKPLLNGVCVIVKSRDPPSSFQFDWWKILELVGCNVKSPRTGVEGKWMWRGWWHNRDENRKGIKTTTETSLDSESPSRRENVAANGHCEERKKSSSHPIIRKAFEYIPHLTTQADSDHLYFHRRVTWYIYSCVDVHR